MSEKSENKDSSIETEVYKEEYRSGFTWRVGLAIVYSAVIIQPAAIYLYFVTNQWFIGAVLNTTIVLFAVFANQCYEYSTWHGNDCTFSLQLLFKTPPYY